MQAIPPNISLNLLLETITPVSSAKDLGLLLDSHLTYDCHISEQVSSCMSKLCQINRVNLLIYLLIYLLLKYKITLHPIIHTTRLENDQSYAITQCAIKICLTLHFIEPKQGRERCDIEEQNFGTAWKANLKIFQQ